MNKNPTESDTLRAEAEARLSHTPATESRISSNEKLLHELQVHRIELEMQHEELLRAHVALEESRDRYVDLYEFAPVGYLTLTDQGLIAEINLTATELLGVERSKLLSRRFAALVATKDSDKWYLFFSKVMKHNKRLSIELMLNACNDTESPVQLDCICVNSMLRITLTDITKIKRTEAALHEAEIRVHISDERMQTAKVQEEALNRLQKIASQLPGMVFQFCLHADGSSHFSFASAAIHDIYRLSPEEVREDAAKLWSTIHPDDYDGVISALQKSARDLTPFSYEYRVKFDDGTVSWLLSNAIPERNVDGSTRWHGFVTDITERRLAEEQTRFHATLLSAVGQAVVATDTVGSITYMNSVAESLYGWRFDEAEGHSILEVTVPQMSRADAEAVMLALARRGRWSGEILVKHRNVTSFPVEVHDTPIFDERGKLIGIIVVSSDITERKRIETALELEHSKLAAAFENSSVGFVLCNAQGSDISMNATALRLFEYASAEDRQRTVEETMNDWELHSRDGSFIPHDEWPLVRAIRGDFVRDLDVHYHNIKSGNTWVCNLTIGPVRNSAGDVMLIVQTLFDITENKRLEQALHEKNADLEIAKSAAEEANLAKSTFLSRMSHELRTPLNAILGYAQLLEVGSPPLTATHLRRLQPIIKAGWYLLELINEILDLAMIESGNLSLSPESLSLLDVMQECLAMVHAQADEQGIQLNFIQFDSTWMIFADRTRVKQVLLNLLSNAIKYNREQGMVEVKCTHTSECICVSIKDNGEGLSPEKLAQLFKPFNRLGQETGAKEGTGIGLVVTKELVEQMGGTIRVESTVGVGSEFCIELICTDRRIKLRTEAENLPI